MTSCNVSSLTVFDQVRGIPTLPGALSEAKLSMALLSSSTDGSESNSSTVGRQSMTSRAAGDTVVSLE